MFCPLSLAPSVAGALVAIVSGCDAQAESVFAFIPALASLTADLAARNHESIIQQAFMRLNSIRSALLARKTRVMGAAKRLSRKQCKVLVGDFEAADVTTEQLRVWAAVAFTCVSAASPLLASPLLVQAPVTVLRCVASVSFVGELGSVISCDGLRVVRAAGPGLKWFEPHSRNEFSVVLGLADGSVPVWLTSGDVLVDIQSAAGTAAAGAVGSTVTVTAANVTSARSTALFSVEYESSSDGASEAVLQLSVCGVVVADTAGDAAWSVCVPRMPLGTGRHECAALGRHVGTLAVVKGHKQGMAVSVDEKWLVVGLVVEGTLFVYSLPGGELVRTFGGCGDGPLQFRGIRRVCFAPNGDVIVVDAGNKRLQEVTLEGVFVRFFGVGEFGDGGPFCIAVQDDVIAVGCELGTGHRVVLFEFSTGVVMSRFGEVGTAPGQLSKDCTGIRFTPDGSHVIVAEQTAKRLSLFRIGGDFVRCVGVGVLKAGYKDVLQAVSGEYVVADYSSHRVCVLSPDGSKLVRVGEGGRMAMGGFSTPLHLLLQRSTCT